MALIEPIEFVSKKGKRIFVRSGLKSDAKEVLTALIEIAGSSPFILSTAEDFQKKTVDEEESHLEKYEKHPRGFFLLGFDKNKIIAAADFAGYKDSKRPHRGGLGISVHQDYRQEGIGRKLMEILIQKAKGFSGLRFIELDVMDVNKSAFEMYKKLGFEVVHTTPQAYQLPDGKFTSNIMMRLEIKK